MWQQVQRKLSCFESVIGIAVVNVLLVGPITRIFWAGTEQHRD